MQCDRIRRLAAHRSIRTDQSWSIAQRVDARTPHERPEPSDQASRAAAALDVPSVCRCRRSALLQVQLLLLA